VNGKPGVGTHYGAAMAGLTKVTVAPHTPPGPKPLQDAIDKLNLMNDYGQSHFLTQDFTLNFNFEKVFVSGKALAAFPNGDADVGTYGQPGYIPGRAATRVGLKGAYTYLTDDDVAGDLTDIPLRYLDPEHYELQILPSKSNKVYFKGSEEFAPGLSKKNIRWRLNYCSTPGDPLSRYSTILFGTMRGTDLDLSPNVGGTAYEFPVSGNQITGDQMGYGMASLVTLKIGNIWRNICEQRTVLLGPANKGGVTPNGSCTGQPDVSRRSHKQCQRLTKAGAMRQCDTADGIAKLETFNSVRAERKRERLCTRLEDIKCSQSTECEQYLFFFVIVSRLLHFCWRNMACAQPHWMYIYRESFQDIKKYSGSVIVI